MTLRETFLNRSDVVGTWISLADPDAAELLGGLGFDYAVIDMEHSPLSTKTVSGLLQALDAAGGDTGSIVRVPWNDLVSIKRVLDVGADGILVPLVNTPEAAEEVVRATRYPPEGIRGVGPRRASGFGERYEEYVESANEQIVTLVQIESETGLENAESIAEVAGIDGLFIGPADLSASLGVFGQFESDRFRDAVERIVDAAHGADAAVGTVVGDVDEVGTWVDRGIDFLSVGTDTTYLTAGARRNKAAFEAAVADRDD